MNISQVQVPSPVTNQNNKGMVETQITISNNPNLVLPIRCHVMDDISNFSCRRHSNWKWLAFDFGNRLNFYNCIGEIDGKHTHTMKPSNSRSLYFTYRNIYSIILLAVVDSVDNCPLLMWGPVRVSEIRVFVSTRYFIHFQMLEDK